jgi:hypothetical protein
MKIAKLTEKGIKVNSIKLHEPGPVAGAFKINVNY